jgi:hypothetical protein
LPYRLMGVSVAVASSVCVASKVSMGVGTCDGGY